MVASRQKSTLWGRVRCPACQRLVDVVDGEYARHYAGNDVCLLAMRRVEWRTHIMHRGVRLRIPAAWGGPAPS